MNVMKISELLYGLVTNFTRSSIVLKWVHILYLFSIRSIFGKESQGGESVKRLQDKEEEGSLDGPPPVKKMNMNSKPTDFLTTSKVNNSII